MNKTDLKLHWETIFTTKDTSKVSWYQLVPETSLEIIKKLNIKKEAGIIEVGCGDSFMADYLLNAGYSNITLLDISEKALAAIKKRLVDFSGKLNFIAANVTEFSTQNKFTLWHDRAVFHFLTNKSDIEKYVTNATKSILSKGYLIISTFSEKGPEMCSGLIVHRYSKEELFATFERYFTKLECFTQNHKTPSGSIQNFTICIFQRK